MSAHSELADEVRLLAETVLERLEPALRRTASGVGKPDWDGCGVCPICALTALLRGEQHELVTSLAEHGTAIVTILREALAGSAVDPLLPPDAAGTEAERFMPDPREPADDEEAEEVVNTDLTAESQYTDGPGTVTASAVADALARHQRAKTAPRKEQPRKAPNPPRKDPPQDPPEENRFVSIPVTIKP